MTVLVTGGAGFLGAHLVRTLLAQGHSPVVLDDLSGGLRANVPPGVPFVEGNICDAALVAALFERYRFDVVFHLAAYAAEGLSHFIRRYNYTNNVVGSVTLINEAIRWKVQRFVFTSSIAVYGTGPLPLKESQVPHPEDPYGIAKYTVEQDLAAAYQQFGLAYTIVRPHNLYGPFQSMRDRYRNVVGIFFNQCLQGKNLTIFGDGQQRRAFTYAGDVMDVLAQSAWHPKARNEVFNLGGDTAYSVLELAQTVLALTGAKVSLQHEPPRNEVQHAWSDHGKLHALLGQHPTTELRTGLAQTWAWAQTQGPSATPPFAQIEVTEGLPPSWRT